MALVDLYKIKFSGFIHSLQILPSPTYVSAANAQLLKLITNCTRSAKFGIMHIDPPFNLGNFYVTPIIFPLIRHLHRKNRNAPTMIGPVLIHHQMLLIVFFYIRLFAKKMSLEW